MPNTTSTWWDIAQVPAPVRSDSHEWIYHWAQQSLAIKAMKEGAPAPLRVGGAGPVVSADTYSKLVEMISEHGAKRVEESFYVWDDDFEEVYVWDTGAAFVTSADEGAQLGVNLVTTDYDLAEKVRKFLHDGIFRKSKTNQGRVFVLVQSPEGILPTPLGFAAVPLEVDNYAPEMRKDIQHIVSELQTPFPDGRLVIFEGPPGCGKTFLIRSLVHEVSTAKFIFVPPGLVPNLGDPSLVSALLAMKDESSEEDGETYGGPTVLICEDADSILVTRASDNMPSISSVLNLTSGLLGDVIDIRVIATTNAPKTEIDAALLRSGRLSKYLHLSPLTTEQATSILHRLVPDNTVPPVWEPAQVPTFSHRGGMGFSNDEVQILPGQVLLANVFKTAKKLGWTPKKSKAKVDGIKIVSRRPRTVTAPAAGPKPETPWDGRGSQPLTAK